MVCRTPFPWHGEPPFHGILNPLPMVYRTPIHGILNPLPIAYSYGIMNPPLLVEMMGFKIQ